MDNLTQLADRRRGNVTKEKAFGATYTPKGLSDFVAGQLFRAAQGTKLASTLRILDPAVGDGELLVSLLGFLTVEPHISVEVFGFETDEKALNLASARLKKLFPQVTFHLELRSFLDFVTTNHDESRQSNLFQSETPQKFDLIIANPPYVRTQTMGAQQAQTLARQFGLTGRIDLYYAFILGIGRVLKPDGFAGLIVSNRFMVTKSGSSVRRAILERFEVCHVWDMGDTKLFKAAVLPAVLLLRGVGDSNERRISSMPDFTSTYVTDEPAEAHVSDTLLALETKGVVAVEDGRRFLVQHGTLNNGGEPDGVWRIATRTSNSWLSTVAAHTWGVFGDIGKIRVGVKTTADKVFIRSDWDDMPATMRPELLRPLVTHHVAQCFKAAMPKVRKQILYPHYVAQGKRLAINLRAYPKTQAYLDQHREILESRKYVVAAGRKWYEIWVPQDPDAWVAPKVVFRDISREPTFWMDEENSVVNGDCYWLTCEDSTQTDLLWLALAVGNSKFIEMFYDRRFHNRLYAGRRRFITQYVEKFPLPNPYDVLGERIVAMAKRIYTLVPSPEADVMKDELDQMVWQAFGLPVEETRR